MPCPLAAEGLTLVTLQLDVCVLDVCVVSGEMACLF